MAGERVFQYWKAMTPLEADDIWWQLQIQKFTHLKKGPQRKFENSISKQRTNVVMQKQKVLTTGEMFKLLTNG